MKSEHSYKSVQIPRKRGRPRMVRRFCGAQGCTNRAYGNNSYCQRCTRRFQRHGDPNIVLKRGRKKGLDQ